MTGIGTSGEKELDRPGGNGELAGRLVGRVALCHAAARPGVFGPRATGPQLWPCSDEWSTWVSPHRHGSVLRPDVANELFTSAFPYPETLCW